VEDGHVKQHPTLNRMLDAILIYSNSSSRPIDFVNILKLFTNIKRNNFIAEKLLTRVLQPCLLKIKPSRDGHVPRLY
jgi:hypothetical protein